MVGTFKNPEVRSAINGLGDAQFQTFARANQGIGHHKRRRQAVFYAQAAFSTVAAVHKGLDLQGLFGTWAGIYRAWVQYGVTLAADENPLGFRAWRHARQGYLHALPRADQRIGQQDGKFVGPAYRHEHERGDGSREAEIGQRQRQPVLQVEGWSDGNFKGITPHLHGRGTTGGGIETEVIGFENHGAAAELGQGRESDADAQEVALGVQREIIGGLYAPIGGQAMGPSWLTAFVEPGQDGKLGRASARTSDGQAFVWQWAGPKIGISARRRVPPLSPKDIAIGVGL